MNILDAVKKVLGIKPTHLSVTDNNYINTDSTVVSPVIVVPKSVKTSIDHKHYTEEQLKLLSKLDIVELGAKLFGIDMSIRRKKEDLIEEFLL
jgi:hypothetical protein